MAKKMVVPKLAHNVDDLFNAMGVDANVGVQSVLSISVDSLVPYRDHKFEMYSGERRKDMVDSIRQYGILTPLLVRLIDNMLYEILAGHNRHDCAKEAGLIEVPCIVLYGVSDQDAADIVAVTNFNQRGFSELTHSGKAAVLAHHHARIFAQGKRTDIDAAKRSLENGESDFPISASTSGHDVQKIDSDDVLDDIQKFTSRDVLAREYELNARTVARYLRVFTLIDDIKIMLDKGRIPLVSAVELSFLSPYVQVDIVHILNEHPEIKIPLVVAKSLRKEYEGTDEVADKHHYQHFLFPASDAGAATRAYKVSFSPTLYNKYFQGKSVKEVDGIIEKALLLYYGK